MEASEDGLNMNIDPVTGLVLAFAGLIVALVVALWYLSDRMSDKIGEVEVALLGKFDVLIEKVGTLASEISVMKELVKAHQTVNIHLEKSNLDGTLSARVDEITSSSASYSLSLERPISETVVNAAISKLGDSRLDLQGSLGSFLIFRVKTRNLDESARIVKSFLDTLDEELSKDSSKEWADSFEKKLNEML